VIPYDMQAPVAVRCLWTNCYTLPLPLPALNMTELAALDQAIVKMFHPHLYYLAMSYCEWLSE